MNRSLVYVNGITKSSCFFTCIMPCPLQAFNLVRFPYYLVVQAAAEDPTEKERQRIVDSEKQCLFVRRIVCSWTAVVSSLVCICISTMALIAGITFTSLTLPFVLTRNPVHAYLFRNFAMPCLMALRPSSAGALVLACGGRPFQ